MALPLAGHRVAITRAPAQAGELTARLEAAGARVLALPTIKMEPPADITGLDAALTRLDQFDGFVFTSTNAVEALFDRARATAKTAGRGSTSWVCAVGAATAAALARQPGWAADVIPAVANAEGVVAALAGRAIEGQRILFPRAAAGREVIPDALARRGARVSLVEAYRTGLARESEELARSLFPAPHTVGGEAPAAAADTVVFTSSSTARNLAELLGRDYRQRLRGVALAALGPVTAATIAELGLAAAIQAASATSAALVEAVIAYWNA